MWFENESEQDSQHLHRHAQLCKTNKQAQSALRFHLSSSRSDTDAVGWS